MKNPMYRIIIFTVLVLTREATSSDINVSRPVPVAVDRFVECVVSGSSRSSSSNNNNNNNVVIYTPTKNSSSFNSVLQARIRNGRFMSPQTPKPVAIVAPTHVSHVQATVVCAKEHGLQLRIRSGGHDYEGLSYRSISNDVTFVILDMFNFRSIHINDIDDDEATTTATATAWVEAGATLGELYYNIANRSKTHAFPAGVCPGLCTGGHFSGGGYGNMMRKYGLSVDNVIDAVVVDADGNIHDRASMGEDLFWAIRGGGGASFAVILSWKIKLVRVPERVTVFRVRREQGAATTEVVFKWQQVAPKLDADLFIRLMPIVNADARVVINFIGLFLGPPHRLVDLVNQSFPELNLTKEECREMSWLESTLFWADYPMGTPVEEALLLNRRSSSTRSSAQKYSYYYYSFKSKSDYVKKVIPKEGLERIWKMMIETAAGGANNTNYVFMQWNPYGGKMSDIPESDTAFPHRAGNLFLIQYYRSWSSNNNYYDPNNIKYNIDSLRALYDGMAPYVSKHPREAFLNYRDLDIGSCSLNASNFCPQVYGSKYFKDNFQRLTKVKAMVDPTNFFRNEQSIPPPKFILTNN